MIRAIGLTSMVLGVLALGRLDAAAQAPVHSFAELSSVLKVGEYVYVTDAQGIQSMGRVISWLGGQIELEGFRRPASFLGRIFFVPLSSGKRYILPEDSVRRIKKDDSTLNGMLIGTAVGAVLGVAMCSGSSADETCPYSGVGLSLVGMAFGELVDDKIKTSLYISQHRATITFGPLLTPNRVGLAAAWRF